MIATPGTHRPDPEMLLAVFETSPLPIVFVDRDGHLVLANVRAEEVLGLTHSHLSGRAYDAPAWVITDFDGHPFPNDQLPFTRVRSERAPVKGICHAITNPDGRRVLLSIDATPLFDADGDFHGMVASLEDVTEKVAAERALRESEALLRSVFRAAPVGIGVVRNRILTWVNQRLLDMLAYVETEVIGQSARLLYPSDAEFDFVGREMYQQIAITGSGSVETRWITKKGRLIDVLLSSAAIEPTASDRRVTFSALDITERKLMAERLQHSEKMEAIGQLAGGIAHDFNNQLAGIMGYAELLRDELIAETRYSELVEGILTSVQRSSGLTAQLLAFARKGKYLNVPVDIHRVIFEVVALLKHSLPKTIRLSQSLDANPSTTTGDPSQLENAILNLALNARDAMPEGGALSFSTSVVNLGEEELAQLIIAPLPGNYVKLEVTDSGCGIDPQILDRVFEPFFTTKSEGRGTGLGLSAVYGTVRNHHAGLTISSEIGVGSTFTLYLPICADETDRTRPSPEADFETWLSGRRVLFVDDEPQLRKLAHRMLTPLGCEVVLCSDGDEAIATYRKNPASIDLVVLDLVMPNRDGKSTFRELWTINPKIRVLLLSGYSVDGDAQALLAAGARGFLQKPFHRHQLLEHLSAILRQP